MSNKSRLQENNIKLQEVKTLAEELDDGGKVIIDGEVSNKVANIQTSELICKPLSANVTNSSAKFDIVNFKGNNYLIMGAGSTMGIYKIDEKNLQLESPIQNTTWTTTSGDAKHEFAGACTHKNHIYIYTKYAYNDYLTTWDGESFSTIKVIKFAESMYTARFWLFSMNNTLYGVDSSTIKVYNESAESWSSTGITIENGVRFPIVYNNIMHHFYSSVSSGVSKVIKHRTFNGTSITQLPDIQLTNNSSPSITPTIKENKVYILGVADGQFGTLTANIDEVIYNLQTSSYNITTPFYTSRTVFGGAIYTGYGYSFILKLDDGEDIIMPVRTGSSSNDCIISSKLYSATIE